MCPSSAGAECSVVNRHFLNFGSSAGNTDNYSGFGDHAQLLMYFANEVLEHLLGHVEIADHAVFQWPDRNDVRRCPAHHPLGFRADLKDGLGLGVQRHDRRFVDEDTLSPYGD